MKKIWNIFRTDTFTLTPRDNQLLGYAWADGAVDFEKRTVTINTVCKDTSENLANWYSDCVSGIRTVRRPGRRDAYVVKLTDPSLVVGVLEKSNYTTEKYDILGMSKRDCSRLLKLFTDDAFVQWLYGFFAGDGSVVCKKNTFCTYLQITTNKANALAIQKELKKRFGIESTCSSDRRGGTDRQNLYISKSGSMVLWGMFKELTESLDNFSKLDAPHVTAYFDARIEKIRAEGKYRKSDVDFLLMYDKELFLELYNKENKRTRDNKRQAA